MSPWDEGDCQKTEAAFVRLIASLRIRQGQVETPKWRLRSLARLRLERGRPKGGAANQHVSFYLKGAVRRKGPHSRKGPIPTKLHRSKQITLRVPECANPRLSLAIVTPYANGGGPSTDALICCEMSANISSISSLVGERSPGSASARSSDCLASRSLPNSFCALAIPQ
jgi:hypothetical protein